MMSTLMSHEPWLRVGAFVTVFLAMAAWEQAAACRVSVVPRRLRWRSNLALALLNTLAVRLLFPITAAGLAGLAAERGWGVMNHLPLSPWGATLLAVIMLDLTIWLQHVMSHAIPAFWRLHRVHHADLDLDLTTGARFHPLEIVLSMVIKFAAILVIGPPAAAVILFEVVLNASAMFNHGNVRLPPAVERRLRWLLVTPDMHRVHHSIEEDEQNCNFGFALPWWDRWLGTYREQPRAGHHDMAIGLRDCRAPRDVAHLRGMLALPFTAAADGGANALERHGH